MPMINLIILVNQYISIAIVGIFKNNTVSKHCCISPYFFAIPSIFHETGKTVPVTFYFIEVGIYFFYCNKAI